MEGVLEKEDIVLEDMLNKVEAGAQSTVKEQKAT